MAKKTTKPAAKSKVGATKPTAGKSVATVKPAAKHAAQPAPKSSKPAAKKAEAAPSSKKPAAKPEKAAEKTTNNTVKSTPKKPEAKKPETKKAAPAAKAAETKAKAADAAPTPAAKAAPAKAAKEPAKDKAPKAEKVEKAAPVAAKAEKAAAPAAKAGKAPKAAPAAKASSVPAPAPVAQPKVKKPVLEQPEIVIKQAYNPAKLPPFIKKQQQRLIELRNTLLDSLDGVAKETLRNRPEGSDASVGGMHMGDAGSDAYDRDFALSMLSKEQDALYEINEALQRITAGVYGVCELSAVKIAEERLEAIPHTRYTREMQEQIERDQMGSRFRRPAVRSVFGLEDESDDDDDEEEEGTRSNSNNNNDSSLDFGKE